MGKTNGLVGGVTGKIGNVIGYYRRGKYLARAYNPHTTNVRSRLQRLQRARWIYLMDMLRGALSTIRVGFRYDFPGYELPNAMKANMPFVSMDSPEEMEFSFEMMQLSNGKFESFGTPGAISSANGRVTVAFSKDLSFTDQLPADYSSVNTSVVKIGVYCPNQKKWADASIGWNEVSNSLSFDVPVYFTGETVHIYGFLAIPPTRILGSGMPDYCSETLYIGSTSIE